MMVFFHGGGLVAGNLNTDEPQCKFYAAKVPCVVVSIEYPLAPTYKFEAIKEACVEAVRWVSMLLNRRRVADEDRSRTMLPGGMRDQIGSCSAVAQLVHFSLALWDITSTAC